MLQQFLNAGLLDIGEDDAKFVYLEGAADDTAKLLEDAPGKVPSYTLVALDPEIEPDDPVLQEVEAILAQRWKTLRNRFRDRPRQLLRAIILEALHRVAEHRGHPIPAVIWLSGASYLPHADLGAEREILHNFLLRLGDAAEEDAARTWSLHEGGLPRLPAPQIRAPEIKTPKIDVQKLEAGFSAAAGPHNADGKAAPGANPFWPNTGSQWSYHFPSLAAKAVSGAIAPVVDELGKGLGAAAGAIEEPLRDHAKAIRAALKVAMDRMDQAVQTERRRTALLWWRQALYSPSARVGYRTMNLSAATFCMVMDLQSEARINTPRGVEYLLREAIRELVGTGRAPEDLPVLSVPEFCEEVHAGLAKLSHRPAIARSANRDGRMPLLLYVRSRILDEGPTDEELPRCVGLNPDSRIPLDDIAVWLFRDLQAENLAPERGA